jgi:hypothetical protein
MKMYVVPPGNWEGTSNLPSDETYVDGAGGWTAPSGFSAASTPKTALLIERACDLTKRGTHPEWSPIYYPAEYMIKMTPTTGDSLTYEIDFSYHDTASGLTFTTSGDTPFLSTQTYNGTVVSRQEFAAQGSRSVPEFLSFQVLLEEPVSWFGYGNFNQRTDKFTFVPQQGGYTANIEGDSPAGDTPWFGRQWDVSLAAKEKIDSKNAADIFKVNYVVDPVAKTITFSNYFYNKFVLEVPYTPASGVLPVYVRAHVIRSDNTPSDVWYAEEESYLYYSLPHDDIVADRGLGTPTIAGSPRSDASVNVDTGVIVVPADPMPATGYPCLVPSGYWYHKWDRLANDDTFNLQIHGLFSGDTKYVDQDEVELDTPIVLPASGNPQSYPYTNSGNEPRIPIHQDVMALGDDTPPNWYWAWGDVKFINEGSAEIRYVYIDPVPRGNLDETGQIYAGEAGLLNKDRPWDHQEGAAVETYDTCYIRPTREWVWYDVSGVNYDYELRKTRVANVSSWFLSSPTITHGGDSFDYFVLPDPDSDLDLTSQDAESHDAITLGPIASGYDPDDYTNQSHYLFARIVHTLVDPSTSQPVVTATGGKAFTIQFKGFYVRDEA